MIMDNIFSKGNLIVLGTILLLIFVSIIINLITSNVPVCASISPIYVEVGSPVRYSDSTYKASQVLWEFGNGDVSNDKNGFYTFRESGTYQVRLTVNGEKSQNFIVYVKERRGQRDNKLVRIKAPSKVIQHERVVFMADGDSDNWSWEFGESGKVDSREQNPIYVYSKVGTYEVKLMAANMMCPVVHRIEVVPLCSFPAKIDTNKRDPEVDYIMKRKQQIINYHFYLDLLDYSFNMVRIEAPSMVFQNERVIFMADGDSDNWSWEFGESGKVDSWEQNPIHVYSKVGVYEVKLMADNMSSPVVHRIEVVPNRICLLYPVAEDIRKRLQSIIYERNAFNKNYEYLLSKYLKKNPNVPVLINGTKEIDFASYCYGLKIMGKQRSTVIIDVYIEHDKNKKIKRLLVYQISR